MIAHDLGYASNITWELRLMYPQEAQDLLNTQALGWNRNIRIDWVAALCRDILSGKWDGLTGEDIIVNSDGVLEDGQHRLMAIVKAGIPILIGIKRGVPPGARRNIDGGIQRTAADDVTVDGGKHGCAVIASYRWLGRYLWRTSSGQLRQHAAKFTRGEMRDLRLQHPGLVESLDLVGWGHDTSCILVSQPMFGFIHYLAAKTSPELADLFIAGVKSGVGLDEDSPIITLRKLLIRQRTAKSYEGKIDRDRLCALSVKSWLAYEDGRPAKVLKLLSGEVFPSFKFDVTAT